MRNSLASGNKYCNLCVKKVATHLKNSKFGLLAHCSECGTRLEKLPQEIEQENRDG